MTLAAARDKSLPAYSSALNSRLYTLGTERPTEAAAVTHRAEISAQSPHPMRILLREKQFCLILAASLNQLAALEGKQQLNLKTANAELRHSPCQVLTIIGNKLSNPSYPHKCSYAIPVSKLVYNIYFSATVHVSVFNELTLKSKKTEGKLPPSSF